MDIFTKNVITTFLVQVISLFLSIFNVAIIARWLGPEGKGMLTIAILLPSMLGLLLNAGIGISNVYFAGSRRLSVSTLTTNSVGFAILITIIGIGVVSGLITTGWMERLIKGIPIRIVLIAILGFPMELLNGYLGSILQGLQRIITVNIVALIKMVLTLALTVLLVIGFQLGLLGALISILISCAVILAIVYILLCKEGCSFVPRWDFSVMRSTLFFGLKGYIGNIFQFFNYRLDMFFVNYFVSAVGVGIYSVSVAVAELLWYMPNAVSFVMFPKATATRPEVMNIFTPRVFRITMGLTVVGAIGLAIIGKPFIKIIYSSTFISAYIPMLMLLPGVVLLGGGKVLTNEIAGRGFPHYNSITAGLSLFLTVVLDIILIPRYGMVGAALASSIAYTMVFFTAIIFYLFVTRISLSRLFVN